ncbi:hypothetical protein [Eubacterium oxidoreducens]|uniref:Uncharacterized protein n=1 Tax=Eubacterium oxidoreducens TaxID=1732 RepID=A0A1G6BD27_EUBOX|nr:hypothetical protein [Eubacterium oxidoreducens]SDB18504.1 hypothetical protein SAMN02910417_01391 [Eubacterium oxidoreducens]
MSDVIGKYGAFIVETLAAVAFAIIVLSYVKGGTIARLVQEVLADAIGGGL